MDRRRPLLLAAAACILWGSVPLVVRAVDVPTIALVFSRLAIGALGLGVALAVRRRSPWGVVHDLPVRAATGAALLAVHWWLQFAAYRRLPVAVAILILYLAPVGMAVLARRLLGEAVDRRTATALGLALTGFAVVSFPAVAHSGSGGGDPLGYAMAVAAAVTYALLLVVSKPLAQAGGAMAATFVELLGAALLLAPLAAVADWGSPDPTWAWIAVLGLVHTGAATAVYVAALAVLPVARVGVLGYLEPASAVVLGWAVLGERPSPATAAGGLLIAAAGMVVVTASPEVPVRVPG